jgi:hypothetical protein
MQVLTIILNHDMVENLSLLDKWMCSLLHVLSSRNLWLGLHVYSSVVWLYDDLLIVPKACRPHMSDTAIQICVNEI